MTCWPLLFRPKFIGRQRDQPTDQQTDQQTDLQNRSAEQICRKQPKAPKGIPMAYEISEFNIYGTCKWAHGTKELSHGDTTPYTLETGGNEKIGEICLKSR